MSRVRRGAAYVARLRFRHLRKAVAGGCAGVVPIAAKALTDLDVSRGEAGQLVGAFVLGFGIVFFGPSNAPVEGAR